MKLMVMVVSMIRKTGKNVGEETHPNVKAKIKLLLSYYLLSTF